MNYFLGGVAMIFFQKRNDEILNLLVEIVWTLRGLASYLRH
jgi:hypothetical protein